MVRLKNIQAHNNGILKITLQIINPKISSYHWQPPTLAHREEVTAPITIPNQALSTTARSKYMSLLALLYPNQIMEKVYFLFGFFVSPMK